MIKKLKNRSKNESANVMEMIPVPQCETKVNSDDDTIDLLMPRFKSSWLSRLVPPKKEPNIQIHLDKTGTIFWQNVDGKRTVFEIAEKMLSEMPEEMENGVERVGLFAQTLYRQEFITLKDPGDEDVD